MLLNTISVPPPLLGGTPIRTCLLIQLQGVGRARPTTGARTPQTFNTSIDLSEISNENFEIIERCKGEHTVVVGESFPTHISVQIFVSMQPITSV